MKDYFGIKPSTKKEFAIIKQFKNSYIASCYDIELKYFRKV